MKKINKSVNSFPTKDIEKIQSLMNEYLKTKDESSVIRAWERVRDGKTKKGDKEKIKKLYAKIKNADSLLKSIYLVIETEGLLVMLHKGADLGRAYRFKTIHPRVAKVYLRGGIKIKTKLCLR
ncbi:MAG: hypothetical protein HY841_13670 [Bacteroidetes bacterium]|nr:hypothetical protein [Bacteroidota bacterium]